MLFRLKAYLVSILAFVVTAIGGLALFFIVSGRFGPAGGILDVLAGAASFALSSLIYWLIIRTLKCPHCGYRFGMWNYRDGFFYFNPIPGWDCRKCGRDMFGGTSAGRDVRHSD